MVTADRDPQGYVVSFFGRFWADLSAELRDPAFRSEYVRATGQINKIDEFVNAHHEDREGRN